MSIFNDKNGKLSMKRVLGAVAVTIALTMAILMYFLELGQNVSDTLILGILGAGFTAVAMGTFESKK